MRVNEDIPVVLGESKRWVYHVDEVGAEGGHDRMWQNCQRRYNIRATVRAVNGAVA